AYALRLAAQPADGEGWCEYAACLLLAGDVEGYRRACARAVRHVGGPGVRPYHVVRACTLAAGAVNDLALPARLAAARPGAAPARRAAPERAPPPAAAWSLTQRGALEHRAGNALAADLFRRSLSADESPGCALTNWLWLALVEAHLGRPADARGWLARAAKV